MLNAFIEAKVEEVKRKEFNVMEQDAFHMMLLFSSELGADGNAIKSSFA